MRHDYTAKQGDPILDRDGKVVAYFAQTIILSGPRLVFMPRLPMSMLVGPEENLPHDVGLTKHEVHLVWPDGDFRVWRWSGEGHPDDAFRRNDLFTVKRPEGDLSAAIRIVMGDHYLKGLYPPWIEGHMRGYLSYLEERDRS